MLSPTADTIRIFLHVTAAAVWVGGQILMAGLVGAVRPQHPRALSTMARGFARIAWPAYGVVLLTGMWGLMGIGFGELDGAYQATLFVKIFVAILAAMFAVVHMVGRTKVALAVGGGLGLLCSLGALFLGILLHTGS